MYIAPTLNDEFKPFSIVIETPEEAKHLIYKLCFAKCQSDPRGIEMNMRRLLVDELHAQRIDLTHYAEDEEQLANKYKEEP